MNTEDEEFVRYIERLYGNRSDVAGSNFRRLCRIVKEEDKRARHAEAERDAFNTRIGELEAEVDRLRSKDEPKKVTLGYRIRWYSAITKNTRWYTPSASAQIASGGTLFATKDEAHRCLRTLNCGWQKEAKIVRVVRWCKAERKDKP